MKRTVLVYVAAGFICTSAVSAENGPGSSIPEISVKHHETEDKDGTVLATVDSFHRGTNHILDIITYKKAHGPYSVGGGWRIYRIGGEPVLLEDHKKPDGDVELRVYGKSSDLSDFEEFARHPDGSVQPVSSKELTKQKQEQKELDVGLQQVAGTIADSINTHTNVEDVIKDLKVKTEQLEKSRLNKSDENKK